MMAIIFIVRNFSFEFQKGNIIRIQQRPNIIYYCCDIYYNILLVAVCHFMYLRADTEHGNALVHTPQLNSAGHLVPRNISTICGGGRCATFYGSFSVTD